MTQFTQLLNRATGYLYFAATMLATALLLSQVANANQVNVDKLSAVSIGGIKKADNSQSQKEKYDAMRQAMLVNTALKPNTKATGEIRKNKAAKSPAQRSHHYFDIFQAQSFLLRDSDYDGYYHEFSVTFDADVDDYAAEVYAVLYLSKNSGPWRHYYTTDVFTIYGDSPNDEYEVFTRLVDGYSPDDYDVLIDLYEYGYDDIVASFSDADSDELYALPLESIYYDEPQGVTHSHGHGGSLPAWIIVALTGLVAWRQGNKLRAQW